MDEKTSIQQLIDWAENMKTATNEKKQVIDTLDRVIKEANNLLPTNRKEIEEAFKEGCCYNGQMPIEFYEADAEIYFNNKYGI